MRINLEKIKYKNILSVGNSPIEMDLNNVHSTFITGTNGASKSTMICSLLFALFGKPYRNVTKGQLINSINKKALEVELWFNIDNKSKYYIKRGIKPNIFEIYLNGNLIKEDAAVRDYQNYLENSILKMNYRTAKQIVALGTAGFKPFMQLTASERRNVVEDILDIKVFSKMVESNKTLLNSVDDDIFTIENKLDNKGKERDIYEKVFNESLKDNQGRIDEFKAKIENYNKADIESEEQKVKYDNNILLLETKLRDYNSSEHNKALSDKRIYEKDLSTINKTIKFFKDNSNCPTCTQHIDEDFIENKLAECLEESKDILTRVNFNDQAISDFDKVKEINSRINQKISETQSKISSINSKLSNSKHLISQMNEEIVKLDKKSETVDDSKIVDLTKELEGLVEDKGEKSVEKHAHTVTSNILKDNGVKARIISQYIPVINELINKNLHLMDANYKFELDNEFKETIKSRGREAFSYENFSQGEKMRIDLAILFTWRELIKLKNSSIFNVLIMDEIMDGATDQAGIDSIMKILRSLKDNNIFIISHNDKIDPSKFDKHINMVKKGNFSFVNKNV